MIEEAASGQLPVWLTPSSPAFVTPRDNGAAPHGESTLDLTTTCGSFAAVVKRPFLGPEVLEARIAPATFHWARHGDGNWNDPANWYNETTGTAGDGFPNSAEDVVKFVDVLDARSAIRIPDGVTITAGSILFDDDFGYKIVEEGSGKLRLPSGAAITVASTSTGAHEIFAPIQIQGELTVANHSATKLTIYGEISSPEATGSLQKTGAGVVQLTGPVGNKYTGDTTVVAGTLELGKAVGLAVPGTLIISDQTSGSPATTRLLGTYQIGNHIDIYPAGELDLNGFDEDVATLMLRSGTSSGARVVTFDGELKTRGLLLFPMGTGAVGASITGNLNIASPADVNIGDGAAEVDLLIARNVQATTVSKVGIGRLHIDGNVNMPLGLRVEKGAVTLDGNFTGAVRAATNAVFGASGEINSIQGGQGIFEPGVASPGILSTGFLNLSDSTLAIQLNGITPGTGYDQIAVGGNVLLRTTLSLSIGYTPANGDVFTIIENAGTDLIQNVFYAPAETGSGFKKSYPEGSVIRSGDHFLQISYVGGDGNDVTLTALVPEVSIAANGKTATFVDVDGDVVTVKTSRGTFQESDFKFIPAGGAFGGQQLSLIDLSDDEGEFANANITISARRGALGGNSFVNVGHIDATGVDLGKVSIAGDLGRIDVGDGAGLALKSLTVGSLGRAGVLSQESGGHLMSTIAGGLGSLVVKGDIRHATIFVNGEDGLVGSITVSGSLLGGTSEYSGSIRAGQDIGKINIRGSVVGGAGQYSAELLSEFGNIGAVTIGGSLEGGSNRYTGTIRAFSGSIQSVLIFGSVTTEVNGQDGDGSILAGASLGPVTIKGDVTGHQSNPVIISAGGSAKGVVKGVDLAIKSVAVTGHLEWARILAGYIPEGVGVNADASIGTISVSGDWISSTVLAGVKAGNDGFAGTNDDEKLIGFNVRDDEMAVSQIAAIVIKGQAYGEGGVFGIVAEQIKAARIGDVRLPLNPLPRSSDDFFPLAPTGPGPNGQPSNFTLLEVLS